MKSYAIIAYNGVVVIDETPEAEIRFSNMRYAEERWGREQKRREKKNFLHMLQNLLWPFQ